MGALIDLSFPVGADESDWRFSFPAMGTRIDVTGRGGVPSLIARDSCALVADLESLWSVFRPDSDVSRINTSADWCVVDRRTDALLSDAVELAALSGSAFTPMIGALLTLWGVKGASSRIAGETGLPHPAPSQSEVEEAVRVSKLSQLQRDSQGRWRIIPTDAATLRPHIDLGGIAKGATADLLRDVAVAAGARGVLVSVGTSSIAVHGSRADGSAWRVGLRDPGGCEDSWSSRVDLSCGSLSTSGILAPGSRGSEGLHILDPRSGRVASSGVHQATVMCASGIAAEALSTALVVGGVECIDEEALRHWTQKRGVEGGWEFVLMTATGPACSEGASWIPRNT